MERTKKFDVNIQEVPVHILKKSNLSWDETQLIEYIRTHPDEKDKIIELLKK